MNKENESRQARRLAARRAAKQAPDLLAGDRFWSGLPANAGFCSSETLAVIRDVIAAAIDDEPGLEVRVSEPDYHLVTMMGVPVVEARLDPVDGNWFVIMHQDVASVFGVAIG